VEVSSAQPAAENGPRRQSARGGEIKIASGRASGVAIDIRNSSQLLSLLDASAPGPGGKVTILATGTNSAINAKGKIQADRGSVDIRQTGRSGRVNLGGATSADSLDVRADTIKVGALGASGQLNVGRGQLTADRVLQLYAPGSNGTINFIANVTLSSPSNVIAANTVNIANNVVVTIASQNPANVYTNRANYTGFGGNGSTTGTFSGAGANAPQRLDRAPAFDAPGQ
jgi:hypothetical protein